MKAIPWQVRFRRRIARPGVRLAALSVARSNGKTYLVADLARQYLGSDREPSECLIIASDFKQAKVCFAYMLDLMRADGIDIDDRAVWNLRDSINHGLLRHRETRLAVRVVSAKKPGALHGRKYGLALLDEPREWDEGTRDKALAAVTSGMGKVAGCRLIALGTMPSDPSNWFRDWIGGEADYIQVHEAQEGEPMFQLRTMRKANPSLDHLPVLKADLLARRDKAKANPRLVHEWKSRHLNMGVADTAESVLLDLSDYQRAMVEDAELPPRDGPLFVGIDLSETSMAAASSYWPMTGRLESIGVLPGIPPLEVRARRDQCGSLYRRLHASGGLIVQPGVRVLNVGDFLREVVARWGYPGLIACDRKRIDALRDAMAAAALRCEVKRRGVGFLDAGQDIADFTTAFIGGRVKVGRGNLVLAAAMAEARTLTDASGNRKLARRAEAGRRSRARDDAAASAILAVATGWRWRRRAQGWQPPRLVRV